MEKPLGYIPSSSENSATTSSTIQNGEAGNYGFINLIRFIGMMGIVWAHINTYPAYESRDVFMSKIDHVDIYIAFFQIFKFSLICFFIISGFLLGSKLSTAKPLLYLKRRLRTTLKPYALAFLIVFGIIFFRFQILHRQVDGIHSIGDILHYCLFTSHLWYLPNYLICLSILLCFHKFIDYKAFGLCLLTVTIIYSVVTVYCKGFLMSHTSALFAFVFYLWLGAYIKRNNLIDKLKALNSGLLLCFCVVTYILSCIDSSCLYRHGLNTFSILRISNQLYSLCMFALLIKVSPAKPNFGIFNPRDETYGIYLYHGIIIYFLLPKLFLMLAPYWHINFYSYAVLSFIPLAILYFAITYFLSFLLVKLLLYFNLGWLKQQSALTHN